MTSEKPAENSGRLVALIDGAALEPAAGRALWEEFSAYMEAHQGDFDGFAKLKGWHKVAPEFRDGRALLVVRTDAAKAPPPPPKAKPPAPKAKPPAPKAKPPAPKAKPPAAKSSGAKGKPRRPA